MPSAASLDTVLRRARQRLLQHRDPRGAFVGRLSSSALSTATAAMAMAMAGETALAARGHAWLVAHQNADGGWGDTTDSPSNISTTTLCWASLALADRPDGGTTTTLQRARAWLEAGCDGQLTPRTLSTAIRRRYDPDQTFSVPILATCAIAGRLGDDGWALVPALPFELAACPHRWLGILQLRTVSYALPALIAFGQARHHHRPSRNPVARGVRALARRRTLELLGAIQPHSGGYLEAAPLTSFVCLSLLSMGLRDHPVVRRGLGFLGDTVRDDGSWPIDTNLDTWTTSLAVGALAAGGDLDADGTATRTWLQGQQYRTEHPYTRAAPGGWAWTDLSGGVPDADDTPGALLALAALEDDEATLDAARAGVRWLLEVQNRDGGIPTFCRGWGRLPFDRSSPDLTAHTLRAWTVWRPRMDPGLVAAIDAATDAGVRFLLRTQRADGAWVPLWFGNQAEPAEENPLYGTSRVLRAIATVRPPETREAAWHQAGATALRWMLDAQHAGDSPHAGGFGAGPGVPASIEETALALEALAEWQLADLPGGAELSRAIGQATAWLVETTAGGTRFAAAPIGLYFAKLWYSEQLYPLVFTVSALERARRCAAVSSGSR